MDSKASISKTREFTIGTLLPNVASAWGKEEKWTDLILRIELSEKKTGALTKTETLDPKSQGKQEESEAEFHCHKFILSSRSPTFKAMLMNSSDTKVLDLPDLLPSTLTTLLDFIYTDQVEKENVNTELLIAANRFDMKELKKICCIVLTSAMGVNNSIKTFLAARQTKSSDLEVSARNFIIHHLAEVMETPDWKKKPADPEDSRSFAEIIMEVYLDSKSQKTTRNFQAATTKFKGGRYSPLRYVNEEDETNFF
jgi:speckle-type POZ protein